MFNILGEECKQRWWRPWRRCCWRCCWRCCCHFLFGPWCASCVWWWWDDIIVSVRCTVFWYATRCRLVSCECISLTYLWSLHHSLFSNSEPILYLINELLSFSLLLSFLSFLSFFSGRLCIDVVSFTFLLLNIIWYVFFSHVHMLWLHCYHVIYPLTLSHSNNHILYSFFFEFFFFFFNL